MLSILAISCGQKALDMEDVIAVKAEVKSKKAEVKTLEKEIVKLNDRILELEPRKEKAPILVTSIILQNEDFERFTTVQASVQSDEVIYVSSETGGRLTSVTVKEGQDVKRGQLIATVDMQNLKNQSAEIQTSLDLAKDVYSRQERLWDQKIGTEIQFLQAKNNVERLEKTIATINSQLAKSKVYAPISGVINMEILKSGEMASPGSPIVQILNTKNLKIVADVPETFIGNIKKGDNVEVYIPALDLTFKKRVTMIGRTIDASNRTFKVEVEINNSNGTLKPNLLTELKFKDYSQKDVITIPLNVILEEVDGRKYVYAVSDQNGTRKAIRKHISIGESYINNTIVTKGLVAGDEIIIEGARSVSKDDPVITAPTNNN